MSSKGLRILFTVLAVIGLIVFGYGIYVACCM